MTEREPTVPGAGSGPETSESQQQAAPAGEAAPAPAEEAPAEELARLRAELEAAQRRAEENLKNWQRTQADFINYRRRQEQEQSERVKQAGAGLMRDLLPVLDDLERAFATLPPALYGLTWIEGLVLIDRKLRATLERHGLTPIEAFGKPFDPFEHEAVLREEGEPSDQTVVVAELQRGYRLHDRVLRPTMVKVGRPREESKPAGGTEPGPKEERPTEAEGRTEGD